MLISNLHLKRLFPLIIWLGVAVLSGCANKVKVEGFSSKHWKQDRYGCEGYRASLMKNFDTFKSEFTGMAQNRVMQLLGRPEEAQLFDRDKKQYTYYLSHKTHCDSAATAAPHTSRLQITFNSIGYAKVIVLEQ